MGEAKRKKAALPLQNAKAWWIRPPTGRAVAMQRYRPNRRMLDESLAEAVDVDNFSDLVKILSKQCGVNFFPAEVTIEPDVYDARCGWHTHCVIIVPQQADAYPWRGVRGMTDGWPRGYPGR